MTEGGIFPFNLFFSPEVSVSILRETEDSRAVPMMLCCAHDVLLCPWCCAHDVLLCPWYYVHDALLCPWYSLYPWCSAVPMMPYCTLSTLPCLWGHALSLDLCGSGCSKSQGDSTPYKTLLGWPTDLDSLLSILTPTAFAAKLHMARMISHANGRGNQSISQSGQRPPREKPIQWTFGMANQPMSVVQKGNLSLRVGRDSSECEFLARGRLTSLPVPSSV